MDDFKHLSDEELQILTEGAKFLFGQDVDEASHAPAPPVKKNKKQDLSASNEE